MLCLILIAYIFKLLIDQPGQRWYYYIDQFGQYRIHQRKKVIFIYSKFINLEDEKRDRIINASMKEFVAKGFDNASTNEIVKSAGISKGLLFHYFKSKKLLYEFLYDYCIEITMNDFYKKINLDETDFFIKLREILKIKLELLYKYPEIFKFAEAAYYDTSSEAKEIVDAKNLEILKSSTAKLFANIDISKFKENINITNIINITFWSLEGFSNEELKKAKLTSSSVDYEKLFNDVDVYLDVLKKGFYK